MAGLTSQGFSPKTLEEIQEELRTSVIAKFAEQGETVNVNPSSRFGQLIDIFSNEMASVWEGLEDVYNSYFPLTSFGTSLDKSLQLVNIERLKAKSSEAEAYLIGDANTSVPQLTAFTVTGGTNDFSLSSKTRTGTPDTSDYVIADDCLAVTGDKVATSGTVDLSFDGNSATINFDDTPAQIKTKLEALPNITTVTVIGDFDGTSLGLSITPSFVHISLDDSSLVSNDLTVENNTLLNGSTAISLENNYATATDCNMLSDDTGPIQGVKGTIVTAKDVVSGLDSAFNIDNAILGRNTETDAEFRARRYEELTRLGTSSVNGIKESVIAVIKGDNNSVSIIENDSDVAIAGAVAPNEMPAHSIEVFVNADTDYDDDIAQSIYDSKAAGIQVVSTDGGGRTGSYTDANGNAGLLMPISSTIDVVIYIRVQRTTDLDYPSDGDDQIKANLVNYFSNFEINQDVYQHKLYTPINRVDGISDLEIFIGTTAGPSDPNVSSIAIASYELATLIASNIIVEDIP